MGAHLRYEGWRWTSHATRGNGVELMPVYKRKYDSGTVSATGRSARLSPGQAVRIRHQSTVMPPRRPAKVREPMRDEESRERSNAAAPDFMNGVKQWGTIGEHRRGEIILNDPMWR